MKFKPRRANALAPDLPASMSAAEYQAYLNQPKSPVGKAKARKPNATAPVELGAGSVCGVTEIIFPGRLPGNNGDDGLLRMNHFQYTALRNKLQYVVMAHRPRQHKGPVRLELIRHSTGVPMDDENLSSTGKIPIDAIVRAGVLPDDNPAIITERDYTQTKALSKDAQFTLIRITDL